MCVRLKPLFEYKRPSDFHEKLVEWIGDIFYDILPEHGYEVRDEQIYTAFQIADALCDKKVHLAEAGLGTGKTFAYLLPSIAYARFVGKPMIIACASTALQEQLCGERGDIKVLSELLDLNIDARMAKDSSEYICDLKVEELNGGFSDLSEERENELKHWLSSTKRGERNEIPSISDDIWRQVSWEEGMPCDTCLNRGYCKLIKAKEYYRASRDIIVVDHDLFFKDLWTRDERKADGKSTILPDYAGVIFDEGHKVILPAAVQAGHYIKKADMNKMIESIEQIHGARESFMLCASKVEDATEDFFQTVKSQVNRSKEAERYSIESNLLLLKKAEEYQQILDKLLFELQVEQELYMESLPLSLIRGFEIQLDRAMLALHHFRKNKGSDSITWIDNTLENFYVVPRHIDEILNKYLYQKPFPTVFTSATLSNNGDFSYLKRTLGLSKPSHSTVGNSFELDKQVEVYIPDLVKTNGSTIPLSKKIEMLVALLEENNGSALILTNSVEEVNQLRLALDSYQFTFPILWEDEAERGFLIRQKKENIHSVLGGYNFWEGIDIPGEALTMVIIWQLPFPSFDPFIEAQRKDAMKEGYDVNETVDYPSMGLKLKQGCGRLIRTKDDYGKIIIMDNFKNKPYEKYVLGALPEDNVKLL